MTPKETITYRGDSRDPNTIFNEGFQTRGSSNSLELHVADNTSPPSNFISTSKSQDVAAEFGSQFYTENGYIYAVKSNNGIDVNSVLGRNSPAGHELEVAIPGGVRPGNVLGATPVNADGTLGNYSILNPKVYGR
ncbi:enterotoxin A family protein [Pectobacterium aroidearum]|uniref:enterotoxin A family protein n=1 Tax=Pectobacterium aroidearum TaxID=1201031 RepID=UPI0021145E74|nr:enterotoxin A family protein [Pectobacterium aroidearum]UUE59858.1 enterotoxin A family protein [Pectobacterium aroidearum]UUE72665.1 enterotoxin A family protein [Pectobacterium aroidearum]UUE77047.1 enterotoxin A family protein [Pectobacterium aroidearum]UUE81314.1 enterotoxin A family protein [Pectobacterium aroidearum]